MCTVSLMLCLTSWEKMGTGWQDEQMMVDVHFLTGTETTGFNLHINGEGAGAAVFHYSWAVESSLCHARIQRC